MAGSNLSKETSVIPGLVPNSTDPDKCFTEIRAQGRYKDLVEVENIYDETKKPDTVRFVCISDTHNKTEHLILDDLLPDGDVLLHGGDFTGMCTRQQLEHFNEFLGRVKHKYKHVVVICGNHEVFFDPNWHNPALLGRYTTKLDTAEAKSILTNCTYIEDETITLFGINIYGSPWQPWFCDWGFNVDRGEPILKYWNQIPDDTDILITHGPPLGIGDLCGHGGRAGCAELLYTVMDRVRPRYHLFGHIHEAYGMWNDGTTTYINASTVNQYTFPRNKPIVFDYQLPTTTTEEGVSIVQGREDQPAQTV